MKKLIKFLLVLSLVLVTAIAAGSSVFAEGEDPQQEVITTPEGELLDDKDGVNVQNNPIESGMTDPVNWSHHEDEVGELTDDTIKVNTEVHDIDIPPHEDETIVEEEIIEDSGKISKPDWNLIKGDQITFDPDDIRITIYPELGEEVTNITVIKRDTLFNIFGEHTLEVEAEVDEENKEGIGSWVIKTDALTYKLGWDKEGFYAVPKKADLNSNYYDKIYISIWTDEMKIDPRVQEPFGGLDLIEDEIEVSVKDGISEEAIVFDGNNVDNYVEEWKYDWAYDQREGLEGEYEGLTINNIKYYTKTTNPEGIAVNVDDDVVSLKCNTEGEYDVFLAGWYTQKQWNKTVLSLTDAAKLLKKAEATENLSIQASELGKKTYSFTYHPAVTEDYQDKVLVGGHWEGFKYVKEYETVTKTRVIVPAYVDDIYVLDVDEGWATFAKIKVNAVEAVSQIVIEETDDDGNSVQKWIVAKESEVTPEEATESIFEIEETSGEEIVGVFDIDLYKQVKIGDETLPVEKDFETISPQEIKLTISADKVTPVEGKQLQFVIHVQHIDKDGNESKYELPATYRAVLNEQGEVVEYEISFFAREFSLYAVGYENVDIPQGGDYEVVNTGVVAPVVNTTANLMTIVVFGAYAALIALKRRQAVR